MSSTPILAAAAAALTVAAASSAHAATAETVRFTVDGTPVVGTLFRPDGARAGDKLPAIIVQGPWTQVKEQVGHFYGRRLADQGFAVLAFDNRHFGASGGQPRQFEDPQAKFEDLSAAVTWLTRAPGVDGGRIYGLGVCFGAGYMADLAVRDPRLAGFATVAAWIHDDAALRQVFGAQALDERYRAGEQALRRYRETGEVQRIPAFAESGFAAMTGPVAGAYYGNRERGVVPQWTNDFATMSLVGWQHFEAARFAPRVRQPVLMIHSDGSALPDTVRRFHAELPNAKKRLVWASGDHLDFYDQPRLVDPAVQQIAAFFKAL